MSQSPKASLSWQILIILFSLAIGISFTLERYLNPSPRGPASESLLGQDPSQPVVSEHPEIIDLGCLDSKNATPKALASTGSLVRIQAQVCQENASVPPELSEVKITNVSNGYEGTVFYHGEQSRSFTSDYMVLKSGKNKIQLQWRTKDAPKPSNLTTEIIQD